MSEVGTLTGDAEDAIEAVVILFNRYASATDLSSQGFLLTELFGAVSDLATWHHRYNSNTGEIESDD